MKQLETNGAIFIVRPNGIIEAHKNPNWDQPDTPETVRQYALKLKEVIGNDVYGLLTFAPSLYVKKETLEAFASVKVGNVAGAVLVSSVGSKIFANFALKFIKTPIPKKIFTKQAEAEKWLLEHIEYAKQKRNKS
ncbi:MAG: hypothetical protein AB8E82_19620 [Aureispira sp.]